MENIYFTPESMLFNSKTITDIFLYRDFNNTHLKNLNPRNFYTNIVSVFCEIHYI